MAKQYAALKGCENPEDVICLDAAYHGHTQSIVDISPYKWRQCTDGKEYHKARLTGTAKEGWAEGCLVP